MTAQETFRAMVRTQVAPRLRALGFKGSGQTYELRSADYWAMLGFQKSAFSDRSWIRFTVNVLVVSQQVWEEERQKRPDLRLPRRPNPNHAWGFTWWRRLGELVHDGQEIWWEVEAGVATQALADAVLWAVEDYALPAMRAQMTRR